MWLATNWVRRRRGHKARRVALDIAICTSQPVPTTQQSALPNDTSARRVIAKPLALSELFEPSVVVAGREVSYRFWVGCSCYQLSR